MRAALVTEYRKLVTTRLWWVLLLAMVVYMAFIAAILAWGTTQGGGMAAGTGGEDVVLTPAAVVRSTYTIAVTFGYVFPLVVGALSMSTEFRHRTITLTFLAEPRRTVVLVAKLAAGGALGAVFGVAGTLAAAGAGAGVLAALGEPTFLAEPSTWRILASSALALAVWALIGVAFGTVLTSQVAVVVVLLAFTQLVEPVARAVLGLTSWGEGIAAYLPGAAGEAISGGSFYAEAGFGTLLTPWQGLAVLLGYVLVFSVIGRLTTLRRDIT
jgi:ABC-2 type transport system permease protein